jgi:hypothetical protein
MYIPQIDDQEPEHHNGADFARGFGASFGGAMLGSALDRTRFGRWFNTSPTVGVVYRFLARAAILVVIFLAGIYAYELFKVW